MKPAVFERVERHTGKQTNVGQTKEREFSASGNEAERDAGNCGRQEVDCCQQHKTFVHRWVAAKVERQTDQDREDQRVAKWDDQEWERRMSEIPATSRSIKRRPHSYDHYQHGECSSEVSESLMDLRALFGQRHLRDKQQNPRGHNDAMQVNDAIGKIGRVEEELEIVSAGEAREYDQREQNCCKNVKPSIIYTNWYAVSCGHWGTSIRGFEVEIVAEVTAATEASLLVVTFIARDVDLWPKS
jgi:hypothetical protein